MIIKEQKIRIKRKKNRFHKPRYAIEFSEDPFQNEVHRYGDPFDISGISIVNTCQFHLTSKLPKMIFNVKKI